MVVYKVIKNYDDLLEVLFIELSGDAREDSGLEHFDRDLHINETNDAIRRIMPYIEGLQDDGYAEETLRQFILKRTEE